MAALELIGYTFEEAEFLTKKITLYLIDLDFAKDIVWIADQKTCTSITTDLENNARHFLRVYTRSENRAYALVDRINFLCAIEVIYINISVINQEVLIF